MIEDGDGNAVCVVLRRKRLFCDGKWQFSDGLVSVTCLFSVGIKIVDEGNMFVFIMLKENRGEGVGAGVGGYKPGGFRTK